MNNCDFGLEQYKTEHLLTHIKHVSMKKNVPKDRCFTVAMAGISLNLLLVPQQKS